MQWNILNQKIFIIEDGITFDDLPIIICHNDDHKCKLQKIVHNNCLLDNFQASSDSHYLMKLWCECGAFMESFYQFTTESEKKNEAFELDVENLSCPLCLEKKISLNHFNKCKSIGQRNTNSSLSNYFVLSVMEIFFLKKHLSSSTFAQDFSIQIPPKKAFEQVEFVYPNIGERKSHNDKDLKIQFQNNKIQIVLSENMKSFRTSSLSHIFKAISTIITHLKEYCSDPTEANFETMKGQSEFMLAILKRASRTILHLENCQLKGFCLSGIDSTIVRNLFSKGMEILGILLKEKLDIFACVEHLKTQNGDVPIDDRRNSEMNTLSYTYNYSNLKCNKQSLIQSEFVQFNDRKDIDLMLGNKIDQFEKLANSLKMKTSTKKRKHQDVNNKRSKKFKK